MLFKSMFEGRWGDGCRVDGAEGVWGGGGREIQQKKKELVRKKVPIIIFEEYDVIRLVV